MSDIQEEQKRLYKRAEEIDKEQEINNKFSRIVREKMKDKSAVEMIVLQDEEINRLNNIIDELKKYLIKMSDRSWDDNGAYDDILDKLNELKGDNK